MTIIIDLRCLTSGGRSGVEVYTENLLTHLLAIDQQNNYKIFTNSWRQSTYNFDKWLKYKNVSLHQFH